MTSTNLYIPDLLEVGFVKRTDTYLQTLAYVTYIDQKGVHRKQTSWENWRDKSIEPIDLLNTPQSGFILNKNIQRYGWSHYSSGRSMIRIYDPRGVEFEITPRKSLIAKFPENLPEEYEKDFIRGIFDGDGSISKPSCPSINFVGTKSLMDSLRNIFHKNCSIKLKLKNTLPPLCKTSENVALIGYSGKNAFKVLDWLYSRSTIETRLDRKYERYINYRLLHIN